MAKADARPAPDFRLSQRVLGDLVGFLDVLAVVGMAVLVEWLAGSTRLPSDWIASLIPSAAMVAILAVLLFRAVGLYRLSLLIRVADQSRRLLLVFVALSIFSVCAALSFAPEKLVTVIAWLAATPAALVMIRALVALVFRKLLSSGRLARKTILFGPPDLVPLAQPVLARDSLFNVQAVFALPSAIADDNTGNQTVEEAWLDAARSGFDDAILIVPSPEIAATAAMQRLATVPMRVAVIPLPSLMAAQRRPHVDLESLMAVIADKPVRGWGLLVKTCFDRGAALALLPFLALVMIPLAIRIKMESPGPVIFRQRRRGYNGRVFTIWKFRSMRVMEDGADIRQAKRDDDRVTRIGAFMRRTSLDELPQIINVLRGQMSIVGPRPHAIAHDDHYSKLIPEYWSRFRVKPGLTGWAQVNGFRGETETIGEMVERIKRDNEYADNWSLWLDIVCAARTPLVLLHKKSY